MLWGLPVYLHFLNPSQPCKQQDNAVGILIAKEYSKTPDKIQGPDQNDEFLWLSAWLFFH